MRSRRVRLTILACALSLLAGRDSSAQAPPIAKPVFHGVLQFASATGRIDRRTDRGVLETRRWVFFLTPVSDGIYPDREPILIALGEDSFLIPAGALRPSRGGTVFAYRGPRAPDGRRVRSFRLSRKPDDGFYTVSFKLEGANLARLQFEDPLCLPLAVIVGDDDGFLGVELTSPSFRSRRLRIPKICLGGWPWLGR